MAVRIKMLSGVAVGAVLATNAFAQGAAPSPFLAIENEPAPKLVVDPPLPVPLSRGVVLIPYRVENMRIVPVLGADAVKLSPRVGHLHVTVDDLPWHWGDFSDTSTIVVVGLPPGEHKVLIELANPEHRVFSGQTVTFTVPDTMSHSH
ncbi:MAG: hypothetical protein JO227_01800 [Acetobacteraceae bacterium]|nr:hypothetical protein [Acetobacteraceae bacterium]